MYHNSASLIKPHGFHKEGEAKREQTDVQKKDKKNKKNITSVHPDEDRVHPLKKNSPLVGASS